MATVFAEETEREVKKEITLLSIKTFTKP